MTTSDIDVLREEIRKDIQQEMHQGRREMENRMDKGFTSLKEWLVRDVSLSRPSQSQSNEQNIRYVEEDIREKVARQIY